MIRVRIFFMFLLSSFISIGLALDNPEVEFPDGQSVYVVIADTKSERDGKTIDSVPMTRICKLEIEKNKSGQIINSSLSTIQEFDLVSTDIVDHLPECRLLLVGGQSHKEYPVAVISTDTPWKCNLYKPKMFQAMAIVYDKGLPFLANYRFSRNARNEAEGKLSFVDPISLTQTVRPLTDWNFVIKGELLDVGEKLTFRRTGLEDIVFRDSPPKDMISDIERLKLIHNAKNRVILQSIPPAGEKSTRLFCLNRDDSKWTKLEIKGDRTSIKTVGDFIACRVGWGFPEEEDYGPVYTGKWIVVPISTMRKQEVSFRRESNIIFATNAFVLAVIEDRLEYFPVLNGEILETGGSTLFKGKDVCHIVEAFLGPKDVSGTKEPK